MQIVSRLFFHANQSTRISRKKKKQKIQTYHAYFFKQSQLKLIHVTKTLFTPAVNKFYLFLCVSSKVLERK